MTAFLGAVLALVGAVALTNLVLTMAIIRRLRLIEDRAAQGSTPPAGLPRIGAAPTEFALTTTGGATITAKDVSTGTRTVLFLSTGCQPCTELAATLARDPALVDAGMAAVVTGMPDDPATQEFLAGLPPALPVGVETDYAISRAFSVTGYPTVLRLEDGVITAAEHSLAAVLGR